MKPFPFFKSLSWLLGLNMLIKPVWLFGIDRAVQNRLGLEAYGTYFSQLGLCIALGFLSDMGLTNLLNRELAAGTTLNIRRLVLLKGGFSFLYAGIICCIGFATGIKEWSVLLSVIGIQVLTSFFVFFRAIITAAQRFRTDAWTSVLDKSILIVCCGILLYTPLAASFTLSLFLWLQIGALAFAVVVAAVIVHSFKKAVGAKAMDWVGLLRMSAPFLILILLMSAHNRLDVFLLERLHPAGTNEAGIYAAAYRLLDAGNIAGYLVASFLVPYASKNINNTLHLKAMAGLLAQFLLLVAIPLVVFTSIFSPWVKGWLYPDLPHFNPQVLCLCMAALPAYYLTHIYGSLLTAKGAIKTFSAIVSGCLAINVACNILLVPTGAEGCCIAALVSQYLCALGCITASKKEVGVGVRFSYLPLLVAVAGLFAAIFYGGKIASVSIPLLIGIAAGLTALLMFAAWQRSKKILAAY